MLIGAAPSLAPAQAAAAGTGTGTGTGTGQGAGGPGTGTTGPGARPGSAGPASGTADPCPRCGVARAGQFCESCGYDFTATSRDPGPPGPATAGAASGPPGPAAPGPDSAPGPDPVPGPPRPSAPDQNPAPPRPAASDQEWAAVVTADRGYYDSVQAAGGPDAARISFPVYCPRRRFRLDGPEIRIGRRSTSSGISPDIDLSVPPADPGISRLHAVLLRAQDGSWSVVDPGSANGTVVNGHEIPQGQAVPLRDGDRIHLGAWTELRLIREQAGRNPAAE